MSRTGKAEEARDGVEKNDGTGRCWVLLCVIQIVGFGGSLGISGILEGWAVGSELGVTNTQGEFGVRRTGYLV